MLLFEGIFFLSYVNWYLVIIIRTLNLYKSMPTRCVQRLVASDNGFACRWGRSQRTPCETIPQLACTAPTVISAMYLVSGVDLRKIRPGGTRWSVQRESRQTTRLKRRHKVTAFDDHFFIIIIIIIIIIIGCMLWSIAVYKCHTTAKYMEVRMVETGGIRGIKRKVASNNLSGMNIRRMSWRERDSFLRTFTTLLDKFSSQ